MSDLSERIVEAGARAIETQMASDDNMPEDIARACIAAALAAVAPLIAAAEREACAAESIAVAAEYRRLAQAASEKRALERVVCFHNRASGAEQAAAAIRARS
jgi:hypothetical protein